MDDRDGRRIREELEHHLASLRSQLEAEGWEPEEARREALRRFGDPDTVRVATRAASGSRVRGLAGGFGADVTQALRGLRRAPSFVAAVVVTLTLALGAAVSTLGVVWDVLLRPLAMASPEGLVALTERHPETGTERSPVSYGTFQDWRRDLGAVERAVGYEWVTMTLEDPERPVEFLAVNVSGDFFSALGIEPVVGRAFRREDEVEGARSTVAMLAHDTWVRRFGADPDVVGRRLPLDGADVEVVGVVPPRLDLFPDPPAIFVADAFTPADPTNRGSRTVHVVGRLRPGATVVDADAEVAALGVRIADTYPTSARGWGAGARTLREHVLGHARVPLLVALAGAGLLLLVGAVNVTNLLLVRATDGAREMAVRAALGASRVRLVRLCLVEAGLLALAGGAGALIFAVAALRWLSAAEPDVLPRALEGGLPGVAVAGCVLFAGLVALGIGVVPAMRAARSALGSLGRGAGAGRGGAGRPREILVVGQLAVTAVLLVGSGLLVRTVEALRDVDLGYRPDGVVAARVSVDRARYTTFGSVRGYFDEVLDRVRAIPGVEHAGLTSALPMDPIAANFDLPTRSDRQEGVDWGRVPQADFRIVGPGLMEALGFRLLAGRTIEEADGPGTRLVALVNRSLADLFWPGEEAVGRRVESVWRQGQWFEVVGVVEDTHFYGPAEASRPELFVPFAQIAYSFMTVVARGGGDPTRLRAALERAVIDTDPLLPPQEVFTVESLVDSTTAASRFYAVLLTTFGALALALAAAGVYGVLAYTVRTRTREIGVRLALGAGRSRVVRGIVRQGVVLAAVGAAVGVAGAIPASRLVAGMLFGVERVDPATLAAVVTALAGVASVACLLPAARAARLDPARVLRDE